MARTIQQLLLITIVCLLTIPTALPAATKSRVIVLTDIAGEPDDQQSLVRFLAYANEFDVEGLIATTSCWKRDNPEAHVILDVLKGYEKALPNLQAHASGYPSADYLRSVTKSGVDGYAMKAAAQQLDNEGIDHIIAAIDRDDPRPVWVLSWGGSNTLGGAVMKVKNTRCAAEAAAFVSKIRGYEIALQDDGHAYIAHHFPHAWLISICVQWKGMSKTTPTCKAWPESWGGNNDVCTHAWVKEHIQENHGSLGKQYPSAIYLWEGDTPTFLYLIPNGLSRPAYPHYGCWGGRFQWAMNVRSGTGNNRVDPETNHYLDYTVLSDANDTWTYQGKTYTDNRYAPIFRWREHYQHDFAARMDWAATADRSKANHNPVAVLNGDKSQNFVTLTAKPGDTVTLFSTGSSDPDNDAVTSHWMVYPEAGTYQGDITLSKSVGEQTAVTIPQPAPGAPARGTIHVILTVCDKGSPPLVAYRRAIIRVN